jgi:dolichol-phosphate mannosyltransferase
MEASRLVVTVCTYNERENIATLVPEIRRQFPVADVLVIDDSSPDGTADVVRQLQAADPQVRLLLRTEKSGLGAATLAGFQHAMELGYDFLINMDADWSHPPSLLPALWAAMADADVAIASRYVAGGAIEGWSALRHCMSRGVNVYSHLLLGLKPRDCSGAYRCYRSAKLREIDFDRFRSRGYAFQEELLYRCVRVGCRVREVPYTFVDRKVGQSKINGKEVVRALWNIACLGGDRLRGVPVRRENSASFPPASFLRG